MTHPADTVSQPYVVWAETRTASASLSAALRVASGRPALEDEPFLYTTPREHAAVYRDWCETGDPAPLYRLLADGPGIKHIAEFFDDNFNADLARAANQHGYRHVRLDRRDVFAQLASRGVAEQLGAWDAETARRKLATAVRFEPFDVGDLLAKRRLAQDRWEAASRHLPAWLPVWTEDLVGPPWRRTATLTRVFRYLGIPPERLGQAADQIRRGDQDTESVLARVPNVGELLAATS